MEYLGTILIIIKILAAVFALVGVLVIGWIVWEVCHPWDPNVEIKMPSLDPQAHRYLRYRIQQILDDIDKETPL